MLTNNDDCELEECWCIDCDWNVGGECAISGDPYITLGEDCPYREEQ